MSSEIVISVNADGYFDKEDEDDDNERQHHQQQSGEGGGFLSTLRNRFQRERRGFLATTVLPALQKTRQEQQQQHQSEQR